MSKAAVALVLALAAASSGSVDARLEKRDAPLQTLVIPVTVDENLRYSVQINMSSNTDRPQIFQFALSTGTGYTVVAGSSCQTCEGVKSYDPGASSTSLNLHAGLQVNVANVEASGLLVKENCSLHQSNGSAWFYPNQTVVVANQSASMFTPGISGIFGLGTNGRDGNFNDTVMGGWRKRNPTRANFTYGMALNPPKDGSTDGGQLHWVAPDTSFIQGDVAWNKLTAFNATAAINTDWYVQMDGWSVQGNSGFSASRSGGGLRAFLDPWLPVIVFPQSDTKSIYSSVQGAKIITKGTLVNIWTVPCSAKMNLTLTFGGFSTSLDEKILITKKGTQCTSILQEWAAPSATEYLLGSAFIASIYLLFSINNSQDGALGMAQRASVMTKKINTVSTIGIALGSAAFVIAVLVVVFFIVRYYRRRRTRKRNQRMMEQTVQPFPTPLRSPVETTSLLVPGPVYSPTSPAYSSYSEGHGQSTSPVATSGSPILGYYIPRPHHSDSTRATDSSPPSYTQQEFDPYLMVHNPTSPVTPLQPPPPGKKRLRHNDSDSG